MRKKVFPFTTEEDWLKLRVDDITSTEVSALFNISPYLTHFELWHRKKSKDIGKIQENERMTWGKRLQESIARGIEGDSGWAVQPLKDYIRLEDYRIGSSFDYLYNGEDLLEIKNVDGLAFKDGWIVDGDNIEAPPHIELQVQHQMLVYGCSVAHIGALIGGNKLVMVKREKNQQIHDQIISKVAAFWKSIEENKEPDPDFERDAKFIAQLYNKVDKEKTSVANDEIEALSAHYKLQSTKESEAKREKEIIKAKILIAIGDTAKVLGSNFSITASEVAPKEIAAYTRKGFRTFKINFKGEKNDE
jgi:putative phage-type endonuclease